MKRIFGLQRNVFRELVGTSSTFVTDGLHFRFESSDYTSGAWTSRVNSVVATIEGATFDGTFSLDGSNDRISVAASPELTLSVATEKTLQVWVLVNSYGAANTQVPVFGKLSSSFNFDGYWGGLFSNAGAVRVVTNGGSGQRVSTTANSVLPLNTWKLFTFVSRISAEAGSTRVALNDVEIISTAHGTDSYSENNPLYFGFIGAGVSSLYLNGRIGAAYFYTRGLSAEEISANFEATRATYGV